MTAPVSSGELYAYLKALSGGIDTVLSMVAEDLLAKAAGPDRPRSFNTTAGQVNIAYKEGGRFVTVDEVAFFQWVTDNYPEEIEEPPPPPPRVKPMFRAAITSTLIPVGDVVMDKDTGEVCEFASVKVIEDGAPYVSYPATKAQKAAKEAAGVWVLDRAAELVEGMRPALEAS